MAQADIVRPGLIDVEVTPKAACGEAIRAVRVIIGRSKPNVCRGEREKRVAPRPGVQIAAGAHPETVLEALLSTGCMPALDGANPATLGLPPHLDGCSISRT